MKGFSSVSSQTLILSKENFHQLCPHPMAHHLDTDLHQNYDSRFPAKEGNCYSGKARNKHARAFSLYQTSDLIFCSHQERHSFLLLPLPQPYSPPHPLSS